MIIPPPSVIASWPRPNYASPESQGPVGLSIGGTIIVLVTIILLLRLYTRRWISNGFGLDDVLIICAYVPALAFTVVGLVGEQKLGWGRHVWDIPPENTSTSLKTSLATLVLFDIATSLTKLSMLAMLYKLTSASADKKMNIVILGLSAIISLNAFIFIFVTVFQCRQVSDYWTPSASRQDCIDEAAHLEAAGIINTITDFILVFLPMRTVMSLKLPWRQRIVVLLLFSAGFLACIAGIIRVYFTAVMTNDPNFDRTWNSWASWIASVVELGLGIKRHDVLTLAYPAKICASIPAVKPFFTHNLPAIIGAARRRSGKQTALSAKNDPNSQSSNSRWSYDDKSAPLPARLVPAFIKQHTRGVSLQDTTRSDPGDELRLLPTISTNNQNKNTQHKRSTSLQNIPPSPIQPLSTFVHKRGASLQAGPQPSHGDEPRMSMDVNKPLPSIRKSQALAAKHIGHPTIATNDSGIPTPLYPAVYDSTQEAMVPPPLALRKSSNGSAPTTEADVPQNPDVPDTPSQQQRDGVRFSREETRLSTGPRNDRTTVLIMFKGDEEMNHPPPLPTTSKPYGMTT
ncbi:Integral membrane protein [Apiospora kogelbergensis]|uniref:Integral membrane protein n=1 Tax=Apiospora kogelbergensis TaxID=1337665 RepID=A0AAW0QVI5_9PEZI